MKIRPDMVVHNEVLDSLIEEDFLDAGDELVFEELRRNAEAMSLDAEAIVTAAKEAKRASTRTVPAPEPFVVNPQRERQEAQKRLNERIKTTAQALLNRVGLMFGGNDISRRLLTNMIGPNFAVAIQIFNQCVNKAVSASHRGDWSTDELKKAMDLLPEILDAEVRRLKVKQREDAENRKAMTKKGTL